MYTTNHDSKEAKTPVTPQGEMTTFRNMKNGDVGVIVAGGYADYVVMRTHEHIVSLNNSNSVWLNIKYNHYTDIHAVRLYPAKTQIVLTVN